MSQYYYILNSRPNKPNMRIEKPQHRTSFPCKFVRKETVKKEEVKVEEMPEFDVESAKKHLRPLQQNVVSEPAAEEAIAAVCDVTPEVVEQAAEIIKEAVEETPKKKRRVYKKAEEVETKIEEETEA